MNFSSCIKSLFFLNNQKQFLVFSRTQYQSALSLKKLYPESSLKITTPDEKEINEKSIQKFSGYIPLEKLEITSCRSSGPGGQRVNKINSKVAIRFHLESADWIPESNRRRLMILKKNQLTKQGELIITSDKTRSHHLNLADVLQRLRTIIYRSEEVVTEVSPEEVHVIRKRLEKANRQRLKEKQFRSAIKAGRREFE